MTHREYMVLFICIVIAATGGLIVLVIVVIKKRKSKLSVAPETNVRANVKRKIIKKHNYYICFQFPDGTDKVLKVEPEIYKEIQENETGTLFYKEHIPFMEMKGFEMMRIENKTI